MINKLAWVALTLAVPLGGCANHSAASRAHAPTSASRGEAIVVASASCWLGGIWSDALGEKKSAWTDTRTPGIEHRCKDVLDTPGMRTIEPRSVDTIARKIDDADARVLLHAVADAARENRNARHVADRVKTDYADDTTTSDERRNDKLFAAPELRRADALVTLLHQTGKYAADARAIGLLLAIDRVEIARGLPKHLKIEVLERPLREVFGVAAPALPRDDAAPIPSGTWLSYLSVAAGAAGHAVPTTATNVAQREPLAYRGVLAGLADKLRVVGPNVGSGDLGRVVGAVTVRLDGAQASAKLGG